MFVHAIVPFSQITLIKVWQQNYQKEDFRPIYIGTDLVQTHIALALLNINTIYDITNFFKFFSETQRNFCNKIFDSVEAQHNFAISERNFRTKSKHTT